MKTEKNASSHFRKPVMLKQTPSSSISPLVTPTTLMVNSVFPVDTLYLQFRKDDTPVIHTISFSTITTVEEAKRAITRKLMTHQKLELFELYLPLTGVFLLLPDRMLLSYYLRNSEEITLKKKEIPKREVTVKFPLLSETEEIVHIWKETTAMGLIQLLEKKELKNISESCLSVEGKTPLPMNEPLPIKSSIFYYVTYTTLSDNCPFLNKTNSVLWRTTHVARQEKSTPSVKESSTQVPTAKGDTQVSIPKRESQVSKKDPPHPITWGMEGVGTTSVPLTLLTPNQWL